MIKRLPITFQANPKKVVLQHFFIKEEARFSRIVERVLALTDAEAGKLLADVISLFEARHKSLTGRIRNNFEVNEHRITDAEHISETKKQLLGAYFSKEYSVQSAALFNPSIVLHPDQSGLQEGSARIILSFRATGEGHISSIVFRQGVVDEEGNVMIEEDSPYSVLPETKSLIYAGRAGVDNETLESNYDIVFSEADALNERVIFPSGPTECNGIEDVRFVQFRDEDGGACYYGTYTAYNGHKILSQLIETNDFRQFRMRTLQGLAVRDKGMALFPRKINGKYLIISRLDGENLYIMESTDLHTWNEAKILRVPELPWEFMQIGNCGSPLETDEGWLLITHAVGAFRRYVISAILLDKENPAKVIGYLPTPLLEPDETEREGYVPNVVYSCGALLHKEIVILPYAKSDSSSGIATVALQELLTAMKKY